MRVGLFSAAELISRLLPAMRRAGRGRIVLVSSIASRFSSPMGGWYHASKAALEAYADTLRQEVSAFGVRVVVVQPGLVRTSWHDRAMGRLEERLGGTGAIRQACPEALIVHRTGVNGCVLHPVGGEPIEVPGFVREVVDTTGAGDTHTGVLVAGLLDGLDVVEAARRANAAAAHAVACSGPAQAPLREEIDEFLQAGGERS